MCVPPALCVPSGRGLAPLGVLVLALEQMLKAIAMFTIFSFVLMASMAFALMGLSQSGSFVEATTEPSRYSWYLSLPPPPSSALVLLISSGAAVAYEHVDEEHVVVCRYSIHVHASTRPCTAS